MAAASWEFWIDVGGTFTDCLAKAPDTSIRRHKLLSSGVTKGRVGSGSSRTAIIDAARCNDPANFWIGWRLAIVGEDGRELDSTDVIAFDQKAGSLELIGLRSPVQANAVYELRCDLDAPIVAIRYILGLALARPVPPVSLRLGTTRGTNALVTRSGARTALVTTRGFGDVLEIGYQARPRLFDLTIRKPPVLTAAIIEIDERVTHEGIVLIEPMEAAVRQQLQAIADCGIESLAVCLLHADRYIDHERMVERVAHGVGFREISVSHQVAPLPKFVARADTTVVDAYLNPVLRDYVSRLRSALPGSKIRILTSAGGLVGAAHFFGKDSILSGPAGGVVGFSRIAQAAGFQRAIGFDMGGTSTDVSRFDGRFDLEYETQKAGARLVAPTMAIETVASGGGSICRFDGVKLTVGPESAGAEPGPACYGRGGPLTVTDVNLFLGRIVAERFPFPLDREASVRRLEELAKGVETGSGIVFDVSNQDTAESVRSKTRPDSFPGGYSLEELADGLLRIANANMAAAIRSVTIAKGADPADYVLVAFGGAAPQHACAVARELGIRKVLNHPDAGVLSALGIGLADVSRHRSCGIERPLNKESLRFAREQLDAMEKAAIKEIRAEGIEQTACTRSLDVRYRGVESYLTISWPTKDDFAAAFAAAHRQRYGYVHEGCDLEIVAARVEVVGRVGQQLPRSERVQSNRIPSGQTTRTYVDGAFRDVPKFERSALAPGDKIIGPAVVTEDISTTVIDPGWDAEVWSQRELFLHFSSSQPLAGELRSLETSVRSTPAIERADPAFLEIFNNRLTSIAQQMGVTLRNTASSVNVKERLDFSCAIFSADGRLVANAPHVPVHLGAMEETVRMTIAANPDLQPGDVIATNDPYAGGSHLPDITVVTPVFGKHPSPEQSEAINQEILFFVASRAHHAEIGGMAPGSMPPLSKNLGEEGVLIRNLKIVAAGESRFDALRYVLTSAPYPTRDVAANLADVGAQAAANRQGANDLLAMVERFTWPVVGRYMEWVQDAAERKVRLALARLPAGNHAFTDYLETADGVSTPICVRITIRGTAPNSSPATGGRIEPAATIDFNGTGGVATGNLNANRAIVTAAVIYVLRLLVDEDIPLNHGVLRPIEIVLPGCMLNPTAGPTPETTPAVAGGNVETSQRIVDVLLGALGVAAASQGTMNNVVFGDDSFGYYETICGGSGATADGPGASAVQVHMTNTRLTDPEILERRYPVRVREFSIRRGSGGEGAHRGGDGVVRRLEFLRPLMLSLLTQRRGPHPPYGMAGGEAGTLGINRLIRADGIESQLGNIAQLSVAKGDTLIIETPGGGGFGRKDI
jgi:5-oxoprolinase (ATP-hydrolysing)